MSSSASDSEMKEYEETIYKLFKFKDYKIRGPKGEVRCPFCATEDTNYFHHYFSLLQHAIRLAEVSSNRKQRAKHHAMAKYMAFELQPDEQEDIEKEREDAFHQLRIDLVEMIDKFNDLIEKQREDEYLLGNIARLCKIFDKSLTEPTFCEMYVDFCFHLAIELPELIVDNEKITFKRLLLEKCQEEFEKGARKEEANEAAEGESKQTEEEREEKRLRRRRMLLNIRLIGELYKKKMLTESKLHVCISKLLGHHQNPNEKDIEALCTLMSTAGEIIDHPRARAHMDLYFDTMTRLSSNMKLSSRVRFLLRDVIDLRKNKWQQRRKVEGPKKMEEVHRDAAQERRAQTGRLGLVPSMDSSIRRGPSMDFAPRTPPPVMHKAEKWERGTAFQKGLMLPPHTPPPVMHKAEKKYQIEERQLKGILNKLTPQNFEKLFMQVKQVNIDNVVSLSGVISQIFDKALTEPTFCEMYADFCFHLAKDLPELSVDNEKITFRRLLLNKCQEEFEKGEREEQEANEAEEGESKQTEEEREEKRLRVRRRMLGNIRLIGELYKKKMLTERIMHECISKLLGHHQNPDEENIEALCKLMSTIGEMIDHPKARVHMDFYFDIMTQLSSNVELSSRVRFMLRDVIDLRKNKWQQRQKVEGPKKIEEVHIDAAQERQAQTGRLGRVPSMDSSSSNLSPPGSQISSFRPGGRGGSITANSVSSENAWSEENLRDKSITTISYFYSDGDENEVALYLYDLNAPNFHPSVISIWLTDSFERKDNERELLTNLLINLTKSQYGLFSEDQFTKGFETVLSVLEDAVCDAPRAAEFLGRFLARVIIENVVSLSEIGRLIYEGGEEQGSLVKYGIAADVVGTILDTIKSEKGEFVLNEICSSSNLQLQNFRPPPGSSRPSRIEKYF